MKQSERSVMLAFLTELIVLAYLLDPPACSFTCGSAVILDGSFFFFYKCE